MSKGGLNVHANAWYGKFVQSPSSEERPSKPFVHTEPCIYYAMGGCQKGETCLYSHSFLDGPSTAPKESRGGFVLQGRVANAKLANAANHPIEDPMSSGRSGGFGPSSTDEEERSFFSTPSPHDEKMYTAHASNADAASWQPAASAPVAQVPRFQEVYTALSPVAQNSPPVMFQQQPTVIFPQSSQPHTVQYFVVPQMSAPQMSYAPFGYTTLPMQHAVQNAPTIVYVTAQN